MVVDLNYRLPPTKEKANTDWQLWYIENRLNVYEFGLFLLPTSE